jgi:hypothetical protein
MWILFMGGNNLSTLMGFHILTRRGRNVCSSSNRPPRLSCGSFGVAVGRGANPPPGRDEAGTCAPPRRRFCARFPKDSHMTRRITEKEKAEARLLEQQKRDFTAEGSPLPGVASTGAPAMDGEAARVPPTPSAPTPSAPTPSAGAAGRTRGRSG